MNLSNLYAEFPRASVHWRIQGAPYERNGKFHGMALAYIDARDVMDRLDEAVGPENWQSRYKETQSGRVIGSIGIRIGDDWVWKSDGAGGTHVEAEKGGISDALKRAAVLWGIGRYLYRLDSPWVECVVKMKDGRPILNNGKAIWKAWAVDPWSCVKGIGPAPVSSQPGTPPSEEREPTSAETRDNILANLSNTGRNVTEEQLRANPGFRAAYDSLDPPHKAEIDAAINKRKAAA